MRALTHSRTVLDIESVLSVSIDNAIVRNIVEQTLQQTAVNEVIISSNVNPGKEVSVPRMLGVNCRLSC